MHEEKGSPRKPRRRLRRRSTVDRVLYHARYRIAEFALRGFVVILPWVPIRVLSLCTRGVAWLAFGCLWRYRRRMAQNIDLAMARTLPAPERKALLWRAWNNFARGVLETGAVVHFTKERILRFVAVEGEDHLQRALSKGRGVIALSAHLGAFTLIGPRLAAAGYPFSVVVKHPGDARFARLLDQYRARVGVGTISARPRREAARGILKALRRNRIVLVIADEFKSGGLTVDFLGRPAPAPRGPATLALRTGAPALPILAPRRPDGSPVLKIGEELEVVRTEDVEQSVAATTRIFTRHLEEAVLRYPDQWNWLGFGSGEPGVKRRRKKRRRRIAPPSA